MWAYSGSTESWLMESTLQKLRFMRGERKRRQTDKTDLDLIENAEKILLHLVFY